MVLSVHEAHSVEAADIAELSVAILEVASICSDEGPNDYWEGGSVFRFGCAGGGCLAFAFGFACHWCGLLGWSVVLGPRFVGRGMCVILAEGARVLVCGRGLFWVCSCWLFRSRINDQLRMYLRVDYWVDVVGTQWDCAGYGK